MNLASLPRRSRLLAAASVLAVASAYAQGAMAQGADGNAPEDAVQEVVVTASRLGVTGFTAPTPTTVVGAAQIERRAPTNIAEVLNEIPAFRQTTAPTQNTFTGPNIGQSFADLRGLGSTRTLVLLNGRRHVPTAATGQVVLSMIPTQLIERTEVVTGGASAAWGSDAVAGVVNLILKNRLQGIEAVAQAGATDKGDDQNYKIGVAAGSALGDRTHVIVGGEWTKSRGIRSFQDRDWVKNRGPIGNTAWATNGLPATIHSDDVQFSNQVAGGIITGTPNTPAAMALRGITFLDNGQLGRLQMGQVFGGLMIGGGNPGVNNYTGFYMKVPVERWNALGRVEHEFTDRLRGFAELSYSQSTAESRSVPPRDSGAATAPTVAATAPIPRGSVIARAENPFMPAALRQMMQSAGVSQVSVGRFNTDIGFIDQYLRNRTARMVVGLEGDLGGSWKWDAYYQYGKNKGEQVTRSGRRLEDRWTQAIDVVTNPANGQPICRSTLTNPNDGCVPFNIFGPNASSATARAWVSPATKVNTDFTQQVAAVNVQGDLFDFLAGPISVAAGAEWRKDSLGQSADAVSTSGRLQFGTVSPTSGSVSVKEAYGEVVVRALRDHSFAQSLDFNFAGRITDYSTSGSVATWKAGATWDFNEQVRLRGTISRDIRAPNVSELFTATVTAPFIPIQNGGVAAIQLTGGNPNLKPEKAYTYTAGLVVQPTWLSGFRASVDWYKITMTGQIAAVSAANIVNRCDQGFSSYCALIRRGSTGLISEVSSQNQNLVGFKTAGVDLELSYRFPLSSLVGGAPGDFTVRTLTSYVYDLITNDGFSAIERAGSHAGGGVPKWQNNISLTYNLDRFSGSIQARTLSGAKIDALAIPGTSTSANRYTVPGSAFFNLFASYDIIQGDGGRLLQVFGVVDNLFDQHPPFPLVQNPYYDLVGRAFRVGVRVKH